MRIALALQPRNPAIFETLVEILPGSGGEADAARLLRTVLAAGDAVDSDLRSRMLKALKHLEETR